MATWKILKKDDRVYDEVSMEDSVPLLEVMKLLPLYLANSFAHPLSLFLKNIFTAACSSVSSLPPEEKKRRITELCINQTLSDFKNSAEVHDYDLAFLFEEGLRSRLENVLKKIETSEADTVHREETQTRKYINQIKEEGEAWKAEFKKRRDSFNETRQKYKLAVKSQPQIGEDQFSKLTSKDLKFLQDLPDFQKWNEKSSNLVNRHSICLIQLEKCSLQVQHALHNEQELDKAHDRIAPTFNWDQWTINSLYKTFFMNSRLYTLIIDTLFVNRWNKEKKHNSMWNSMRFVTARMVEVLLPIVTPANFQDEVQFGGDLVDRFWMTLDP